MNASIGMCLLVEKGRRAGVGWLALLVCSGLCWTGCTRTSPEEYIRQFESMNARVRTRAGNQLILFSADEVMPLLIGAADHELIRVRFEVMKMLGRFKDPRGTPVLIRALDDRSPRVAAVAAWALGEMRASEALPELLRYTRDPTPEMRQYVLAALGSCRLEMAESVLNDAAYEVIMEALDDSSPEIRIAALQSLREFGYRESAAQLEKMIRDPSPNVRYVVVQAVGEVLAARALPRQEADRPGPAPIAPVDGPQRERLVELLLERLDPDEYQSIRGRAIRALGESGSAAVVGPLQRLAEQGSEEDRREARWALERLGMMNDE